MHILRYLPEGGSTLSLTDAKRRELEARYEAELPHAVKMNFKAFYARLAAEGEVRWFPRLERWRREHSAGDMDFAPRSKRGFNLLHFAREADARAFVADWGGQLLPAPVGRRAA